jgi:anti-sigma factor RsiW
MAISELTCPELVELITDYLEGSLSAPEHQRFEAHLAECEGCAAYLEQMKQTIWAVGRLTENDLPPQARTDLLQLFHAWKKK